ncbi:unnamed protein product [Nippostrongylus brasiliensis]|uniref:RING-type domain-containing protein n=1 Tax=Nippostrongylus brasiliensis TaxID=27835 RepID=A0A0N4XZB4_NIPBR|nr:unnamed protein product [Nippostrongylus brasiliensis]
MERRSKPREEIRRKRSDETSLDDDHRRLESAGGFLDPPGSVFSILNYDADEGSVLFPSPADDARFSTPEYAPDSVPTSAPTSLEAAYVRSPSGSSTCSNFNARDVVVVGQPAKRATLNVTGKTRYESPKNGDDSWLMQAFYQSSEEQSPDDPELAKSRVSDEAERLETDESDGRVSLVDRLFDMLEAAEEEEEEGEAQSEQDDVNDTTLVLSAPDRCIPERVVQAAPAHPPIPQAQYQPQISYEIEDEPRQAIFPCRDVTEQQYVSGGMPVNYAEGFYPRYESAERTYPVHAAPPPQQHYFPPDPARLHQSLQHVPQPLPLTVEQYAPQGQIQHTLAQPTPMMEHIEPLPPLPQYDSAHMMYAPQPPQYPLPQQPLEECYYPSQNQFTSHPLQLAPDFPHQVAAQPFPHDVPWNNSSSFDAFVPLEAIQQVFQAQPSVPASVESEEEQRSESAIGTETSADVSSITIRNEEGTDTDFESVSLRYSADEEVEEIIESAQLKGPPFEQKGPTRTKDVASVPPPPPPSVDDGLEEKHGLSIIQQLELETERLQDMSLREGADFDRQCELEELRTKMCERFQRLYPKLFIDVSSDAKHLVGTPDEDVEDGDPEEGKVIRNGIQLTTKYLAMWFPDKEERSHMIPWNIVRKVKPIRLCFLDNRIGHGEYENFNIGEFVTVTGHMMFAYGDGPEAQDSTRLFVLDVVRQQMNMRVFTYAHIFGLYKNHPIRLRRLIRYIVEQHRVRHILYRMDVDRERRRGQTYVENRMDIYETGATEITFLKKRAPHIYGALIEAGFEDQLEFLCEERRVQDCDPELGDIKRFLKKRSRHIPKDLVELLQYAKRVSYCSRTGRLSAFRAHRFHEFLGFPDLQTDLIYVLDFMAREIVMMVTYRACMSRQKGLKASSDVQQRVRMDENLDLCYYEEGLRSIAGWRENGDLLFGEEERPVSLSIGKNYWKWESDADYNAREKGERLEFEKTGLRSRRTVVLNTEQLFAEHGKILRGEYWDSCPEDLTKEAIVYANAMADVGELDVELPEDLVPLKWKQQRQQAEEDEIVRLETLKEITHKNDLEKRVSEQLVKMMAANRISDL